MLYFETDNLKCILLKAALQRIRRREGKQNTKWAYSEMMEMRECKLFEGNLSVCEELSGRERAGNLESSKT